MLRGVEAVVTSEDDEEIVIFFVEVLKCKGKFESYILPEVKEASV